MWISSVEPLYGETPKSTDLVKTAAGLFIFHSVLLEIRKSVNLKFSKK